MAKWIQTDLSEIVPEGVAEVAGAASSAAQGAAAAARLTATTAGILSALVNGKLDLTAAALSTAQGAIDAFTDAFYGAQVAVLPYLALRSTSTPAVLNTLAGSFYDTNDIHRPVFESAHALCITFLVGADGPGGLVDAARAMVEPLGVEWSFDRDHGDRIRAAEARALAPVTGPPSYPSWHGASVATALPAFGQMLRSLARGRALLQAGVDANATAQSFVAALEAKADLLDTIADDLDAAAAALEGLAALQGGHMLVVGGSSVSASDLAAELLSAENAPDLGDGAFAASVTLCISFPDTPEHLTSFQTINQMFGGVA